MFSHVSNAQTVSGTAFRAVYKSHREIKFKHTFIITSYLGENLEPSNQVDKPPYSSN